ncbi:MAG: hypothetical protein WBX15_03200 [Thermoanaerobaculia bacterium]
MNLNAPEEWRPSDLEAGRDPIRIPPSASALVSGMFTSIEVGSSVLEIPGGSPIAPQEAKVVDASEWSRRENAAALEAVEQMHDKSRMSSLRMRETLDLAVESLVEHSRWKDVLDLTDWIEPSSKGIPRDLLANRTIALVRSQRLGDARELALGGAVRDAMHRQPDPALIIDLAESMSAAGDFETAIELYKRAMNMADAPDVSQRLRQLELRESLASTGRTVQMRHFDIRCTADVTPQAAHEIGDILEKELSRLGPTFGVSSFRPVRVNVLGWGKFVTRLTLNTDVLGFYDGDITVPLASVSQFTPEIVNILTHELTHAVIAQASNDSAPRWFQEGVAERMEKGGGRPNIFRSRTPDQILSVSLLDATMNHSIDPEAVGDAYAVADAFIQYLQTQYGPDVLQKMIAAYRDGADTDEALRRVTGHSVSDLDRSFRDWGRTATFAGKTEQSERPLLVPGIRFSRDREKQ